MNMKKVFTQVAALAALMAFCAPAHAMRMMDVYPGELPLCETVKASCNCASRKDEAPDIFEHAEEETTICEAREASDLEIIACVVYNEAGYGCTDRHQELVAAVVVNRVCDNRFPSSVYGVVTAPYQYDVAYATYGSWAMTRAMQSDVWDHCLEIAERALRGEIDCPANVLFQAEFLQGSGVYEIGYTSYSTTYFCYG